MILALGLQADHSQFVLGVLLWSSLPSLVLLSIAQGRKTTPLLVDTS